MHALRMRREARAKARGPSAKPPQTQERMLHCNGSTSSSDLVLCAQTSPNPEFAANPGNFAHFWLAHIVPLVTALLGAGITEADLFRSSLLLWHGQNRVLPRWKPQFLALMGGVGTCRQKVTRAVNGSAADAALRASSYRCSVHVRVSVPAFSFRNRSFYQADKLQAFAAAMRSQRGLLGALAASPSSSFTSSTSSAAAPFPTSSSSAAAAIAESGGAARGLAAAPRIVVLLRAGNSGRRVIGLDAACSRPHVVCVRPGANAGATSVADTASALAHPATRALIAGHGAGLALLPFLPRGARTLELDNILNIGRARNMYIYLGLALGHDSVKVWLNGTGGRFCPLRTIACTSSGGGSSVHGCSVGYMASVGLTAEAMDDVLADASEPPFAMPLASGVAHENGVRGGRMAKARACSGVSNDTWRGRRWHDIWDELTRVY